MGIFVVIILALIMLAILFAGWAGLFLPILLFVVFAVIAVQFYRERRRYY